MENNTKGLQSVKIHKTNQDLVQMILCYSYGSLTADLGCAGAATYHEVYARLDNIGMENPDVPVTVGKFQCTLEFAKTLALRSAKGWGSPSIANTIHMERYLSAALFAKGVASLAPTPTYVYPVDFPRTPAELIHMMNGVYNHGFANGKVKGELEVESVRSSVNAELETARKLEARRAHSNKELVERLDKEIRALTRIRDAARSN